MGRYYRTSSATPLDYMYKIDAPLMERAVSAQSGFIDQTLADDAWVGQNAHFKYNPKDAEQASKIIKGYADQTESIASEIMRDPVNYRKQQGAISGLKKKLIEDTTSGAIAAYSGNYAQKQAETAALAKQVELYTKTGGKDKQGNAVGISPENAAKYQAYWDENYKSTDYDPNNPLKYNRYAPAVAMNDIDLKKRLSEGVDKMKANGDLQTRTDLVHGEQYLNKVTDKWEALTPDRILKLVGDNFIGDQQLQQYLRERSKIGAITGMVYQDDVVDPKTSSIIHRKGDLIAPYSVDPLNPNAPDNITPEEQHNIDLDQMDINKIKNPAQKAQRQKILDDHKAGLKVRTALNWNAESGLAPVFRSIIDEYAFSKTEHGEDMKGNSVWNTKFTQMNANARHAATINQQERQNQRLNDRMNAELDLKREKFAWDKDQDVWEREHPKGSGTKGPGGVGSGGTTVPAYKAPEVTGISSITTNSFAGTTTKGMNDQPVQMLSNEGIAADIRNTKEEIAGYDKDIAKANETINSSTADAIAKAGARTSLAIATSRRKEADTKLNIRRDWFTKASQIALNNDTRWGATLTPKEIGLYNEFSSDYQGEKFKSQIKELEKRYPQIPVSTNAKEVAKQEQELAAEKKRLSGYDMNDRNTREVEAPKLRQKIKVLESEVAARRSRLDRTSFEESPEVKAARNKLVEYYDARNKVNKRREGVFAGMRKETLNTDAFIPTAKESTDMWYEIERNPNNVEVFNQYGEKTAQDVLSTSRSGGHPFWAAIAAASGATGAALALGGNKTGVGGDFSTGLGSYLKANDVKVNITRVGSSTNIGNGHGVVEVQFEDPTGVLSNQPFFMSLSPELTQTFAGRFSKHKDPRVAEIAARMGDNTATDVRNQILQPKINNIVGSKDEETTFDVLVPSSDGNKAVLHVTRYPDSERLYVTHTRDGKVEPFDFTARNLPNSSGHPGSFAHVDDLLRYIAKADAPFPPPPPPKRR